MAGNRIKTEHSARLRLVHGEDCEGCQDIGLRMALHVVHLAGWRIVRTNPVHPGDRVQSIVAITDEWLPSGSPAETGEDDTAGGHPGGDSETSSA